MLAFEKFVTAKGSDLCAGFVALYFKWNIFSREEVPLADACMARRTRMASDSRTV